MSLDQVIAKIPRPALVVGVLVTALVVMIYNNPLKDECEIKSELFLKDMRGIVSATKIKSKTQFPQIGFWKDRCREGNSIGACEDYFIGLRKMSNSLKIFPEKCHAKFAEDNEWFQKVLAQGLQTFAMVAWADKPPSGAGERLGWLTEADLKTFCTLKKNLESVAAEGSVDQLKENVFKEYPDVWPEKISEDAKVPENRPKALKTALNPQGTLDRNGIYERSLFSVRCDLYQ